MGELARRAVVMIIEPGLADADAFWMAPRARRLRRARTSRSSMRVIGMRADRAEHVLIGAPAMAAIWREFLDLGRDGDHAPDAGRRARARPRRRDRRRNRENRDGNGCRSAWIGSQLAPASPASLRPPRHNAGRSAPAPAARRRRTADARRSASAKSRASGANAEQIEQLRHRRRHEGLRQDRDDTQHLGRHIEDRRHARRIGLALDPRLLAPRNSDWPRPTTRQISASIRCSAKSLHRRARLRRERRRLASRIASSAARERAGRRHRAAAILGDHRQRALRQIAEIIGEIGVDAL